MRKAICAILAAGMIPAASFANGKDDQLLMTWTCATRAFYSTTVSLKDNPEGQYKTAAEIDPGSIEIKLFRAKKAEKHDACEYLDYYIATNSRHSSIFNSPGGTSECFQVVNFGGGNGFVITNKDWFTIQVNGYFTVDLRRDDNDVWRFLMSHQRLQTARGEREEKIIQPPTATDILQRSTAEVAVYFINGDCLLSRAPTPQN